MVHLRAYEALETRFRRVGVLRSIAGTLSWDAATVMPAGARSIRGEQLSALEAQIHNELAATRTLDLLEEATASESELTDWQRANLREMRHDIVHTVAVPADLSAALTCAQTECEGVWIAARGADDFDAAQPFAQTVLDLTREAATAKGEAFRCEPHDALMDLWDPGVRGDTLVALFDHLADELPGIIAQSLRAQPSHLPPIPVVPAPAQLAICEDLANLLGYDRTHGHIAQSAQACFMDDSPDDVRITTKVNEADYRSAAIGISHEIGHSFYERGVPIDWRYQPVGRPASASFQESQSLLFEKIVMRSDTFASQLSMLFKERAPHLATQLTPSIIRDQIRHVSRGPIRIEADEATYPLHIVIRYRLERAMIEGKLECKDLPDAWRSAYQETLGLAPATNREGCLQDIHWFRGLYGYFQSYALGSLIAAQVFEAAVQSDPAIEADLRRGRVESLKTWLAVHLYAHGRRYRPDALVQTVTGKPLDAQAFIRHLKRRYSMPNRKETAG